MLMRAIGALAMVFDYAASVHGAHTLGATWRGCLSAAAAGLVGLFFAPIGLVVCPFMGAFIVELAMRRPCKDASKAGVGAVLGFAAGALGKFAYGIGMVALFTFNIICRSTSNTPSLRLLQLLTGKLVQPNFPPVPFKLIVCS